MNIKRRIIVVIVMIICGKVFTQEFDAQELGSVLSKIASVEFWLGKYGPGGSKINHVYQSSITYASISRSFKQVDNALRELERTKKHQYFQYVGNETKAKVLGSLSKIYWIKKMRKLAEQTLQEVRTYDTIIAEELSK
jgi:hypothetical protein